MSFAETRQLESNYASKHDSLPSVTKNKASKCPVHLDDDLSVPVLYKGVEGEVTEPKCLKTVTKYLRT